MSPKAVKHSAKEEAVMQQLIHQLGPKTRLAKLTMANWKAEKAARLIKPSAGSGSGIVNIPLEQLEDSPFQLRQQMDSDELAELVRSIRDRGLLNPILVRRAGKTYQVISGHRRLAAYRRLQFAGKTDAEKAKYAAIPARELASVSDEQMLLLGLTENMLRADISPMDAAMGLVRLRKLKPAFNSAQKIAEATGLQIRKVERLLQLAASPEVVQKGVQGGLQALEGDDPKKKNGHAADDGAEEPRTLDLMSALEFTRLHEALSKKGPKSKNGKSPADAQTGAAIARALKDNWGLRDVRLYVSKAIAGLAAHVKEKGGGPGRPGVPFRKTDRQLIVYYGRLSGLTAIQRQSLRRALEELLQKLAEKPKTSPVTHRAPVRKSA